MGVIDTAIRMLRAAKGPGPSLYDYPMGYGHYGIGASADSTKVLNRYRGWVAACVDDIADNCSSVRLRAYDRRTDEPLADDHPLVELLARPCQLMVASTWKRLFYSWMELEGDAFFYKLKNSLGVITELMPIMPDRMRVVPDDTMIVKGYLYSYAGKEIAFERDEIVHVKYPNPKNIWRGIGTLEKALLEADADVWQKYYREWVFKNRARPDGILTSDNLMDDDQIKKVRMQWQKIYGGVSKSAKVAVLHGGLKYQQIQMKPVELDYLNSSQVTMKELIGIFRVPAKNLGIVEDVNRANGEELERTYQKNVIKPKLVMVAEQLTAEVAAAFDTRIVLRFDENVPQDRDFLLKQEAQDLEKRVVTVNEVRAKRGRDPVDWGDEPLASWSEVPISTIMSGGNQQKAAGSTQKSRIVHLGAQPVITLNLNDEAVRANVWRSVYEIHGPLRRAFQAGLVPFFNGQRGQVLDALEASRSIRSTLDVDAILFSLDDAAAALADIGTPHLQEIVLKGMKKAFSDMGNDTKPAMTERLNKWMDLRANTFSQEVNGTTLTSLGNEISVGIAEGESIEQIAARVNKVFDFAESYRAERIAVTEVTGAIGRGSLEAYDLMPVSLLKMWLTSRLPNVREWHQTMDGQTRETNESFASGNGNALMYPGDPDSGPEERINCNCAMTAKSKE